MSGSRVIQKCGLDTADYSSIQCYSPNQGYVHAPLENGEIVTPVLIILEKRHQRRELQHAN